ncbi:MAG: anti-sigma factor family protein [Nocardioidaceae bacterium]
MTDPTAAHSSGIGCHEARMSLGVLVLGAIEPEDRPVIEAHLATCESCSAELAQLAVLPGLMHHVDVPAVQPVEFPGLGDRLRSAGSDLAARRRDQGRRRRQMAGVAGLVAASVAVAVLAVGRLPEVGLPGRATSPVVATAGHPGSAVSARFVLRPRSAGTRVSVSLHGVRSRQRCSLVAVSASGRREVAASWVASYSGAATVEGTTSLPIADIARLQVVRPDGTALASTGLLHHG